MKERGQWITHPAYYLVNCMKEIKQQSEQQKKKEIDMKTVFSELCITLESRDSFDKETSLNRHQL